MELGQQDNISEAFSEWIPIADSKGIWTEFRQEGAPIPIIKHQNDADEQRESASDESLLDHRQEEDFDMRDWHDDTTSPNPFRQEEARAYSISISIDTQDVDEQRQSPSEQSSTNSQEEEHDLRDWHDDATSPIQNRSERTRDDVYDDANPMTTALTTSFESATMDTRTTNKCDHQTGEEPQASNLQGSEPVVQSSGSRHHRRTSSGSLWTGINAASTCEIDAAVSENDVGANKEAPDQERVSEARNDITEPEASARSFFRSFVDPFSSDDNTDSNHSSRSKRGASPNPLRALSDIMSFDFFFGSIPTQEELREEMSLTKNTNADIALGLRQEMGVDNAIVVAHSLPNGSSQMSEMGYKPGMQVVKINGEACPESLSKLYAAMELRIEVMDEFSGDTKVAIIGVHEPKLDLHVHKESKRSRLIYITKVEPNSALAAAGFAPGMRVTRINERRCPGSFLGLVRLLTAKIVAVPKDLAVPIGLETNKTISNLSLPKEDEQCKPTSTSSGHRRASSDFYGSSRRSRLLDLKKSRWLRGGLVTAMQ